MTQEIKAVEQLLPVKPFVYFAEFESAIIQMNGMYELPRENSPTLMHLRHEAFMRVLGKEMAEGEDIANKWGAYSQCIAEGVPFTKEDGTTLNEEEMRVDLLTDMADWLGDMTVYIFSEALKLGLDMNRALSAIMASNETKLGECGEVLKDADGKFLKGPNYIKPEPTIKFGIENSRKRADDWARQEAIARGQNQEGDSHVS